MHQPDNSSWRLCDPDSLIIRSWPEEDVSVVYAGQQRTTHLLDAVTTEVLRCLQAAGPSRAMDLAHALDPESSLSETRTEFADGLAAVLKSLEGVDLVTCRPC